MRQGGFAGYGGYGYATPTELMFRGQNQMAPPATAFASRPMAAPQLAAAPMAQPVPQQPQRVPMAAPQQMQSVMGGRPQMPSAMQRPMPQQQSMVGPVPPIAEMPAPEEQSPFTPTDKMMAIMTRASNIKPKSKGIEDSYSAYQQSQNRLSAFKQNAKNIDSFFNELSQYAGSAIMERSKMPLEQAFESFLSQADVSILSDKNKMRDEFFSWLSKKYPEQKQQTTYKRKPGAQRGIMPMPPMPGLPPALVPGQS